MSTHFRHNMQAFFSVFHLHWIPFSSSLSSYFLHFNPIISVPILYFLSFIDMSPSFTVSFICVPNFKALSPPSTLPQLPTPFPIHQLPTANPHSYLKLSPKCHCFLYLSPFASSLPRKQEFTLPSTFFLLPPELLSRFIFYRHTFLSARVMTLSHNLTVHPPPMIPLSFFSGNGEKCWGQFPGTDVILREK